MRWIGGWSAGAVACLVALACEDDAGTGGAGGGDTPADTGGDSNGAGGDVAAGVTDGGADAGAADATDPGDDDTGTTADTAATPDTSDATDASSGPDADGATAPTPFRSPCGPGEACDGADGACIATSLGDRCTRPCAADSDCDGWRCVFCGDQCPEGALRLQCVPPEDAADVVACEPGEAGFVDVTLSPMGGGDRHLDDAPCTVETADAGALAYTLECPGALDDPLTVSLEGGAAVAPPALVAGAAVRLTWELYGDQVGGPTRFVIRDAGEDRLILASLYGGMNHPVPGDAELPWKLAPLTFEMLDTGCPLEAHECATSLPLALRAHLGDEQATLLEGEVAELGPGPRWQIHLTRAGRVLTPMEEVCVDVWPAGLQMVVTRMAE